MGMLLELIGLAEQQELRKANLINLSCQLSPRIGESARASLNQLCWPLQIMSSLILFFQCPEQNVVFQPMRLSGAELVVGRREISGTGPPGFEICPCCFEQ